MEFKMDPFKAFHILEFQGYPNGLKWSLGKTHRILVEENLALIMRDTCIII
jgi:hypothetical protein